MCFIDTRFNSEYEVDTLLYNDESKLFVRETTTKGGVKKSQVLDDRLLYNWMLGSAEECKVDDNVVEEVKEVVEEESDDSGEVVEEMTEYEKKLMDRHYELLDMEKEEEEKEKVVDDEIGSIVKDVIMSANMCECGHGKIYHMGGNKCCYCECEVFGGKAQ